MRIAVLTGLIAAVVAGVVGFGVGRRSTHRIEARPAAPSAPSPKPTAPAPAPAVSASTSSAPAATTETVDRGPAASKVEPAPAERVPARRRLLDLLLSNIADDKLFYAVRTAAMSDPAIQKKVVEELLATQDPEMLAVAKDSLYGIKDPALLQQVLDAFTAETWPDRKAALAHVIGSNFDSEAARTVLESILSGSDAMLIESALARTSVQGVDRH